MEARDLSASIACLLAGNSADVLPGLALGSGLVAKLDLCYSIIQMALKE